MDTYGDLVTLLLCFFVLLYSFSSVDSAKWEALVKSFSGASGVLDGSYLGNGAGAIPMVTVNPDEDGKEEIIPTITINIPENPTPTTVIEITPTKTPVKIPTKTPSKAPPTPIPTSSAIYDLYNELNSKFNNNKNVTAIEIEKEGKEIRIRLVASILFEPGSATLTENANIVLKDISKVVESYLLKIKDIHTEGHTDNMTPLEGSIESKLELAGTRAARVLNYLTMDCKLNISQAYTIGFGSTRPIASNDTPEGIEKNNRVDIVMIE